MQKIRAKVATPVAIGRLALTLSTITAGLLWLLPTAKPLAHDPAQQVVWPQIELVHVTGGLSVPINLVHAADGSDRLFITEQPGRIRIYSNGGILPTLFLDITDRVAYGAERGLLGLAFPPDYAQKGHFYVHYSDLHGNSTIARFRVHESDPNRANPNSEQHLLYVEQPHIGHNGGQLAFGPDGFLYIGLGEGRWSSIYNPCYEAQDPHTLLGKILRIDVESRTGVATPANSPRHMSSRKPTNQALFLPALTIGQAAAYAIPDNNPFAHDPTYRPEIWSMGVRNPWRFSFDRQTGDLYVADVGDVNAEEINFQPASSGGGANYGWPIMEGSRCYLDPQCSAVGLILPVTEYSHAQGDCAVIGGYVYRGPGNPTLQGIYFFGDLCTGNIRGLQQLGDQWYSSILLQAPFQISTFGEDEAGRLYVTDFLNGQLYRIQEAGQP